MAREANVGGVDFKVHFVSIVDDMVNMICATFPTAQLMEYVIANMNSNDTNIIAIDSIGVKRLFKGSYVAITSNTPDRNKGDGYHCVIYNESSDFIYYTKEDREEKFFNLIKENSKVGILEEWTEYFIEELISAGYLRIANTYLFSDDESLSINSVMVNAYARPTVPMPLAISSIKQKGILQNKLIIPVKKNITIPRDKDYIDVVSSLILPNIEKKETLYKDGDRISPALKTGIILEDGKIGSLYHRQQEIAQAIFNTMANGERVVYLNGGTGVGKTYSSLKIAYMVCMFLITKGEPNFRIGIMSEAHLVDKWKDYVNGALVPFGIKPIIYDCNRKSDVDKLSEKPNGPQVLIFSKDKAKSKWYWRYQDKSMFYTKEYDIKKYLRKEISNIKKGEKNNAIIYNADMFKVNELKYISKVISKALGVSVVTYKEIIRDKKVIGYYIATSSKVLKEAIYNSKKKDKYTINKAYHIKIKSLSTIKKLISSLSIELYEERDNGALDIIPSQKTSPYICPECGMTIETAITKAMSSDIGSNKRVSPPRDITKAAKRGCHYVKSDGTPLSKYEIDLVKRDKIKLQKLSSTMFNPLMPYRDEKNRPLSAKDAIRFKSSDTSIFSDFDIRILVKECGCIQAKAENKKPYVIGEKLKIRRGADDVVVGEYIKKKLSKAIDFLIVDECHLYNDASSNQTKNYLALTRASKYVLPMSGTLTDGKSSNVFTSFFNFDTEYMKSQGYKYNSVGLFTKDYGRECTVATFIPNTSKSTRQGASFDVKTKIKEVAGMSPKVFANYLLHRGVSRSIEDMDIKLVDKKYFKHELEVPQEIQLECEAIAATLKSVARREKINTSSSMVNALLSYPDNPIDAPIMYGANSIDPLTLYVPKNLSPNGYLPKEEKLIETLRREINVEERKVIIYVNYTGLKKVHERVCSVLEKEGFKYAYMGESVSSDKKAKWIKDRYKEGVDVLVINPKRVATGLDIIEYPTIYFYELGYDSKLIRQSEARPYRPSQKKEVRIYYSYYKGTLQEEAVKLVAKKKNAAQAYEGIANKDILATMGGAESTEGLSALINVIEGKKSVSGKELNDFGFANETDIDTSKYTTIDLEERFTIEEIDEAM